METVGIQIPTKESKVNAYSSYLPSGGYISKPQLYEIFKDNVPINAKQGEWNTRTNDSRSTRFRNYADTHNLNILGPKERTHLHVNDGSAEVLGLAVTKNINFNVELKIKTTLLSENTRWKQKPTGSTSEIIWVTETLKSTQRRT